VLLVVVALPTTSRRTSCMLPHLASSHMTPPPAEELAHKEAPPRADVEDGARAREVREAAVVV
jgi:hypothetical protein